MLKLLGRPARDVYEPELVALAYAKLYDQRAGAIEIKIKEDKQGVGINRRRKKRAAAQAMLTLLGTLAHNVLVWAREWLSRGEPRLKQYGIVRLFRTEVSPLIMMRTALAGSPLPSWTQLRPTFQFACVLTLP